MTETRIRPTSSEPSIARDESVSLLWLLAVLVRDLIFWGVMRIEGFPPGFATAHAHTGLVGPLAADHEGSAAIRHRAAIQQF